MAKRPNNGIEFVYFDIGNVIFDFRPSLERLSKKVRRPLAEVISEFGKFDKGMCSGTIEPQELWERLKPQDGPNINFLEFISLEFLQRKKFMIPSFSQT